MARMEEIIRQRLSNRFQPERLEVVNESAHHAGHMGDDGSGESHFAVEIVAASFAGQTRLARQRLVNAELADLLAGPIHALRLTARAPGEG